MGATSADDISSAAVEALLAAKSGKTGDAGRSPVAVAKDSSARQPQYGGVISTHAQHSVPPEVAQAIRAVRTDAAENQPSWCLLGYDNGATPALQVRRGRTAGEAGWEPTPRARVTGGGDGKRARGGDAAAPRLLAHHVPLAFLTRPFNSPLERGLRRGPVLTRGRYALVRLTQLVDRSTTVKFAFISWVGDDVAPMRKAKLSTLRGEAASILAPVHTELLNVTSAADVSNSTLMRQLEGSVSIN